MQRSATTSSSTKAYTALRRAQRSHSDEEDLADPRPWETRAPLRSYGSSRDVHPTHSALNNPEAGVDLPLYDDMEAKRRFGDKETTEIFEEKTELLDDQGKWAKGHGAGPGIGGRRGLPPRQRVGGWVSGGIRRGKLMGSEG